MHGLVLDDDFSKPWLSTLTPSPLTKKRRERDLNSRIQRKHDFQSRAIPGYAISACKPATRLLRLMLTAQFAG